MTEPMHLTHEDALRLINLLTKASWTCVDEDCQLCKNIVRFLKPIERNYDSDLLLILTVLPASEGN